MIEVCSAKSGEYTIRFDGKHLASSVDPKAEAEKWVDKNIGNIQGLRTVFVLSAGAGHHLLSLKKRLPHLEVVCIENKKAIIDQLRDLIQIPMLGISIQHIESSEQLFQNEEIKKGLLGSYSVLRGPAASFLDKDLYSKWQMDLNGRTKLGFDALAEIREISAVTEKPNLEHYSYQDLQNCDYAEDANRHLSYQIISELIR